MASNFRPSAACCSVPIASSTVYTPEGEYITANNNTKVYTSGSASAKKALFILYDVFGYSPQILRGADWLAELGYKVFMPDFWNGSPAPLSWMPLDGSHVDEEALDAFCNGPGNTENTLVRIQQLRLEFQARNAEIERWGLVGYCWGGYVSSFALGPDTPFVACAQLHPGFPGIEIAEKISVPLLALCSKDEPESEFRDFKGALRVECRFEAFDQMVHGWMSARGDLGNEDVRSEFGRGYEMVGEWMEKWL